MKTVEYKEEFGEINITDVLKNKLLEKGFEEQMECYRIAVETIIKEYSYGKLDSKDIKKKTYRLEECDEFRGVVIRNGIIVGIILKSWDGEDKICLPGQSITTYYASDDDGTGSTDREDNCCLICV